MKPATFFALQIKRLWKNPWFLLLLIGFPCILYTLSRAFLGNEDSRIPVGLYLDTKDSLAKQVNEKLLALDDSLFLFQEVSSEEELIKKIQNNQLECGYLFQKDLGEELNKTHLKNLITVYVSENTTCSGVLNELVYANLFEEYSLSLLQQSLADAGHLPFTEKAATEFSLPPVTEQEIETLYRSHLADGSTFRFDVQFVSEGTVTVQADSTMATRPLLRGIAALFLLLCGFLAMLTTYHDEKSGLYARVRRGIRFLYPRLTQLAYLLPAGIICLLSLWISDSLTNLGTELVALLSYIIVLLLFYWILSLVIKNHTILCAAFPMLLLCTLIFTPIIVDLSTFFPWLKVVRYVLPTHYYLLFF